MSELTMTLLRLGYLVLLWVFVFSIIRVLRRDLYGTRITSRKGAPREDLVTQTGMPTPQRQQAAQVRNRPTRLVVTEGPLRGTTLPLSSSAILIGRAPSCTLVLDDDYSSSRHARIFPSGDQWVLEDLGSTNGTFIGSDRVTSPVPLTPGVQVRVGQSVVELQR
ncbi:FHA domain-containing protein FhaB/FipA [Sanguibacter suaedae]|jgi:pSer/pThr/pTyr-binding forkhead associated (FHA) protein|uniref:FHA domain-containing protein n=1 Tax=Sanguibacter suaedae TaxID=2795737 RepID=A0A934I609_9MICO|nr:FHA domain-containing protein [Sanguibacter suaedae]MBI9113837.1 FHA domain-containing protein [Sanguibacter suaedae]